MSSAYCSVIVSWKKMRHAVDMVSNCIVFWMIFRVSVLCCCSKWSGCEIWGAAFFEHLKTSSFVQFLYPDAWVGKAVLILFMPGTERVIIYYSGEAFIHQDNVQPFSAPTAVNWGQMFLQRKSFLILVFFSLNKSISKIILFSSKHDVRTCVF